MKSSLSRINRKLNKMVRKIISIIQKKIYNYFKNMKSITITLNLFVLSQFIEESDTKKRNQYIKNKYHWLKFFRHQYHHRITHRASKCARKFLPKITILGPLLCHALPVLSVIHYVVQVHILQP